MVNQTKIEWTDWTLNPVVGCTHNCPYCYARKQAKRMKQRCQDCYDFKPHAHLERLDQLTSRQKPKRIFIDSMWDWNCVDNNLHWLGKIISKMEECSQHTFQILSKRPFSYRHWDFPPNVWLGTSVTKESEAVRIEDLTRANKANLKFVSFEPLLEPIDMINALVDIGWVIIGAETGHRKGKVTPQIWWVNHIVLEAGFNHIPVFMKNNLEFLGLPLIQQFPKEDL